MANRNEDRNQGQQSEEKRTGTEAGTPQRKSAGAEGREESDVTNEGGMQAGGGTRKPDRTNEGEREGNSNDRQQGGEEEGGMGGKQSGNRGGQNSGSNR